MFLYPLWILFIGALAAALAGLNRNRGIFPSLLSFFAVASSTLVLVPYIFFVKPRVIAAAGGVFLFTLGPVTIGLALCLSIISAGYVLHIAGTSETGAKRGRETASVLLGSGLAMGAIFSSSLLAMVFFTEVSYLFFLAVVKKRSRDVYFPASQEKLFFMPTLIIIFVLIFQTMAGGPGPLSGMQISELPCFFLVVYTLLRLFFFPLTLSSDSMARIFRGPLSACLALFACFSAVVMTMKVLAIGPGVSFIIFLISSMVAGGYSVLAYRQKEFGRLAVCVFFVGTACIVAAAGLHSLLSPATGREMSFIVCNHFTAAAGMILTAIMVQDRAGRTASVFFIVFVLAFVGLLPSAGLAGKIGFYRDAFGEGGNVAIAASIPCFFSFLPVLFYARWLSTIRKGFAVKGRAAGIAAAAFFWVLTANLYLPFLYFIK